MAAHSDPLGMAAAPMKTSGRDEIEAAAPGFDANSLIVAAIVVGALYAGREVLVPVVLAVLLSFVLATPARLCQKLGLGRILSTALVVIVAFGIILGLVGVLTTQLTTLAGDLPRYQTTIRDKIASLRVAATGSGPLERAAGMLQDLAAEVSGAGSADETAASAARPAPAPVPVEIRDPETGPLRAIGAIVTPLLHPLATTGLVAILVVFILLQRGDLRNRLIRLAGTHDLQRTTAAMNDAAGRLSRFFLTQVLLNALFGIVVGVGLWLIGVPSPVLWGILAAISRFIPYVGVVLAAGGPLILAAAVDPHWTMLLATAGFFVAMELVVGQIVEPMLYGHSTGLSPVAVVASVTFWTWLWGPVGLLLATPLTVCLVVLGRYVEKLRFLDVMFGDRPPLTTAEIFYQRMLAGDAGEALEQAETLLKAHALTTYYDEVALKGLALAQADVARGVLEPSRLARIEATMTEMVEELEEQDDAVPDAAGLAAGPDRADGDSGLDTLMDEADGRARTLPVLDPAGLPPGWRDGVPVLCVAGRTALDRAAALMLAQLLHKHGLGAEVESADVLTSTRLSALDPDRTRLVCLSYLDAGHAASARYAVRRLRRKFARAPVVVGAWGLDRDAAAEMCRTAKPDACVGRLDEALRACLEAAGESQARESVPRDRPHDVVAAGSLTTGAPAAGSLAAGSPAASTA